MKLLYYIRGFIRVPVKEKMNGLCEEYYRKKRDLVIARQLAGQNGRKKCAALTPSNMGKGQVIDERIKSSVATNK